MNKSVNSQKIKPPSLSRTECLQQNSVFDGGKIDSVGGHDKLLQKQGIYEDMFMKQSLYYKT